MVLCYCKYQYQPSMAHQGKSMKLHIHSRSCMPSVRRVRRMHPTPILCQCTPLLDREGTSKRGDRLTQQYTNLMELELYTLAKVTPFHTLDGGRTHDLGFIRPTL